MPQVQVPIDPRRMEFPTWANAMRVQNSSLPRGDLPWQTWGQQAQQFEPNWPDPRGFTDWRGWAAACVATV